MTRYEARDADGNPNPRFPLGYCPMSGHSERGCSTYAGHMALVRQGVGLSTIPGPSVAEIARESREDFELLADEFHGRLP